MLAQQCERPAGCRRTREIELNGHAALTQVPGTRGVEQRRELGKRAATPAGRDRGELLAEILRQRQSFTPSSASSRRL